MTTTRELINETFGSVITDLINVSDVDARRDGISLLYRAEFVVVAATTYMYAQGHILTVGDEPMSDFCHRHTLRFLQLAFHDCHDRSDYTTPAYINSVVKIINRMYRDQMDRMRAMSLIAICMIAGLDSDMDEAEQLQSYLHDVHELILVGVRLDLRACGIIDI